MAILNEVPKLDPQINGGRYRLVEIPGRQEKDLVWPEFPDTTQKFSSTNNVYINIYGVSPQYNGGYLVVLLQKGTITPSSNGSMISEQILHSDEHGPNCTDLGRGLFHYKSVVSVRAEALDSSQTKLIQLVEASPDNVNQVSKVADSVTTKYSGSVTLGVSQDGPSGSITSSRSVDISHSVETEIREWNVTKRQETLGCSWLYSQSGPWDGAVRDPMHFEGWWQDAYNMGGDWDGVKYPNDLSRNTLDYSNILAWRVQEGLSKIRISGRTDYFMTGIAMPQLNNQGRHRAWPREAIIEPLGWYKELSLTDLVPGQA